MTAPNPCQFNGGTWGCAKVFNVNTIDNSLVGTYEISISVQGNVTIMPNAPGITIPYQFRGYRLKIYPEDQLGITNTELEVTSLFPNPAKNVVLIDNIDDALIIKFYDLTGQEVKTVTPVNSKMTIDISDLTNGAYMVYVYGKTQAYVHKLIKE